MITTVDASDPQTLRVIPASFRSLFFPWKQRKKQQQTIYKHSSSGGFASNVPHNFVCSTPPAATARGPRVLHPSLSAGCRFSPPFQQLYKNMERGYMAGGGSEFHVGGGAALAWGPGVWLGQISLAELPTGGEPWSLDLNSARGVSL